MNADIRMRLALTALSPKELKERLERPRLDRR